ncbi:hypothetical protein ACOR62_04850 [Neisseria lisongii]|uniref:Lipoprotein n=1 Tax=Neisseria lisongii TaxID=2912188 RepID=A0AAW5ABU6_9NEIS|nr:hypothetical protein [Neisseria lisongii]MCF7528749.1 hypothetical protein [Neisseria lisongii]MCF7529607.1 hypothetical protein [Neisseria lisongii]
MKSNKTMFIMSCIFFISGCTPEGIFDLGYGIRGGYNIDVDYALGSHISKEKADAAWKECTRNFDRSDHIEKCMTDQGLIRLSDIKNRQKNSKKLHKTEILP